MHQKTVFIIAALLFIFQAAFAEEDESSIKITPSGFSYYQIGEIEHMTPEDRSLLPKTLDQHFNGRLTLDAVIKEKIRIIIGMEAQWGASIGGNDQSQLKYFMFKEAQGIYSFCDTENSTFQMSLAAGYFPFKYNPESQNLGEYLFRTGSYPGYVITDFDFPKSRLMGFNLSCTLLKNLQLNALFTSEYVEPPYFDYSLSFVAGYKFLNNILDVGAGIDLDRLLPIKPEVTQDPSYVTDNQNNYVIENGDTLHYTKQGTKLMGRLTFNPKPLLPFAEMLGPDDGKLYGEFAILGTKNYGSYYPDIFQRMPVMCGFNFPTFPIITYGLVPLGLYWGIHSKNDIKVLIAGGIFLVTGLGSTIAENVWEDFVHKNLRLDILSGEIEYYGSDPAQRPNIQTSPNTAKPDVYPVGQPRSFTKWSFYAKKTIAKGWAIKGLIGRDHYRGLDNVGNYDALERMNGPEDWHYNLRIMYSF